MAEREEQPAKAPFKPKAASPGNKTGPTTAAAAKARKLKTAVIVIHGMGEQRPMETLWGFVSAAWTHNPDTGPEARNDIFSQPSAIPGNFELRRVTTRYTPLEGGRDKRVDFYEFYWAHMMTGNTLGGLLAWVRGLLFRGPSSVPPALAGVWLLGLLLYAVGLACVVLGIMDARKFDPFGISGYFVAAAVTGIGGMVLNAFGVPVAGDAARYLSPTPDNVKARQEIREAGVDLLERIVAGGWHDRIVLVGHSLGTVIGYDILTHSWGKMMQEIWYDAFRARPAEAAAATIAIEKLEAAAAALDEGEPAMRAYRDAQRVYFDALRALGIPWLVSDFVTMGSPLSKAEVLLARDADAFGVKVGRMEFPTCPPQFERDSEVDGKPHFSFAAKTTAGRIPHQAAVFAPVVWTNIWFPSFLLLFGDFISGPVRAILGRGVRDVEIPRGWRFRHLDYWRDPGNADPANEAPWLVALWRAINLRKLNDEERWRD